MDIKAQQNLLKWVRVYSLSSHFGKSRILIKNPTQYFFTVSQISYRILKSFYIPIVTEIQDNKLVQLVGSDFRQGSVHVSKGNKLDVFRNFYLISDKGYIRSAGWIVSNDSLVGAQLSPAWNVEIGEYVENGDDFGSDECYLAPITVDELQGCQNIKDFFHATKS